MARDAKPINAPSLCTRGRFGGWLVLLLSLLSVGQGGVAAQGVPVGDTLRITFVGDLLLDRGVRERIDSLGADTLFSASVDSLFGGSQLVVANLECPATHVQAPMMKRYVFRADPEHLPVLRRHGITHLVLANNHSIDHGRRGLMDTYRNIVEAGMVPVGAGENMLEAAEPVCLTTRPREVWLLSSLRLALEHYAYLPERPCVSQEPMDSLVARVAALRRRSPDAYIIVSLHWGGENTMSPILQQVVDAHRLVAAGTDLIVGHHSHTLQRVENYKGATIFYSIGNFIFDAHRPIHQKACAAVVDITSGGAEVRSVPLAIGDCTPVVENR